jgi:hypothetical protein
MKNSVARSTPPTAGWSAQYAALGSMAPGDERCCHKPFCRALQAQRLEFILACNPLSHKTLYEWVVDLARNSIVAP